MKAIQVTKFGGPEVLALAELPDPKPLAGQVLVKLAAIGVNPVETYIRAGTYARLPELPYTPGSDGAGTVVESGDSGGSFQAGDRVFVSGTLSGAYAEKALCPIQSVHRLPANVTFSQGAAIGVPYATAYRALFQRAGARPGETVLIHGATGGVGLAAVQFGRAAGMNVFGTGGTEKGRQLALQNGAHAVFDHHEPDYLEKIKDATGGNGIDVIIEMLANVNLAKDLGLLARFGRVAVVGSRGKIEIDPRDTIAREADIRGVALPNTPPEERAGIFAAITAGLENGTLRPVIDCEIPLAEAPRAHEEIMKPGAVGKILLVP